MAAMKTGRTVMLAVCAVSAFGCDVYRSVESVVPLHDPVDITVVETAVKADSQLWSIQITTISTGQQRSLCSGEGMTPECVQISYRKGKLGGGGMVVENPGKEPGSMRFTTGWLNHNPTKDEAQAARDLILQVYSDIKISIPNLPPLPPPEGPK